ncbi:hypothetical protein HF086_002962 [Spodoptera exigua]|uniref:PiggyBac transposable element-derived protein domain-containing protein n=1 Tax=Spodoptera exigua TaxID=7107 RepID=A0A922MZ42_SPOEX|nr:hypothetical protein HF086_002962 [Spodoptera exigua]
MLKLSQFCQKNKNKQERTPDDIYSDLTDNMRNIFGEEEETRPSTSNNPLSDEDLVIALEIATEDKSEDFDIDFDSKVSENGENVDEHTGITLNTEDIVQPNGIWTDDCGSRTCIEFGQMQKILKVLPEGNDPFDYFNLLANEEFFSMLVTKANSYAGKLVSQIKHPNSRLKLWKDITISEMKTFFGLLFHMGIKSVNRLLENAPLI